MDRYDEQAQALVLQITMVEGFEATTEIAAFLRAAHQAGREELTNELDALPDLAWSGATPEIAKAKQHAYKSTRRFIIDQARGKNV